MRFFQIFIRLAPIRGLPTHSIEQKNGRQPLLHLIPSPQRGEDEDEGEKAPKVKPMPSVFISYSSQQQTVAQQLEAALKEKGIKAWRDKTQLHAGERWPKALGDAIADADALVLLWSAEASQSDFVELEWNIAVAMNTPVMPCLLDDTALPTTLKPSHRILGILGDHTVPAAEQIRTALQKQPASAASDQQNTLLKALTTVPATEPKQVLQQIQAVFHQPNLSVEGNMYQAKEDIHISQEASKPSKTFVERAGAWVALVGGLLAIAAYMIDLPEKLGWKPKAEEAQLATIGEYRFEGQIRNSQDQGLDGVEVVLIVPGQKPLMDNTQNAGTFAFTVTTEANKYATFQATKDGFRPVTRNVTIPNERYVLKMEPNQKEDQP